MVDRSSMYNSIEMRLPFLERKFVEKSVSMIKKSEKIDKLMIRNYMQKNCKSEINWSLQSNMSHIHRICG